MALDFPASPALNQTYLGPNGVIWVWDGTKWVSGMASRQVPLSFSFVGKPAASMKYNVAMPWGATVAANLVGSVVYDSILATANAVFTVNKVSGVTVTALGTITISTGNNTAATLAGAGGTLVAGDVLQVVAPGTQDTTLADVSITIMTVRV